MPMPKRTNVDDYFDRLSDLERPHLEALRELSVAVDPTAREELNLFLSFMMLVMLERQRG